MVVLGIGPLGFDAAGYDPAQWSTACTVVQAAELAALPAPQATIWALDFVFRGAATLRHGQLGRIENRGLLVHEVVAVGFKNVATAKRAMTLMRAGK
jgi:hypothetical protein